MGNWIGSVLIISFLVWGTADKLLGQGTRDLAKIRNATAAKLVEPRYVSEPRYALVVLGADAEKRMWIVLDGYKTLYADLDGDGNLNGKSEKFEVETVSEYAKGKRNLAKHRFVLGEVNGHALSLQVFVPSPTYKSASTFEQRSIDQQREKGWVRSWLARTKEVIRNEGMTGLAFSRKPEDAQVCWLGGPLRIVATDRDLRPRKKLGVAQPTDNYTVTIGSVGLPVGNAKGIVITPVLADELPDVHPIARFKFKAGFVEVELNQVKSRGQLSGQFLLPDGEEASEVEVEISYPKSSMSGISSTTQKISIK